MHALAGQLKRCDASNAGVGAGDQRNALVLTLAFDFGHTE
jgi:hypothetical protein